MTDRVEGIMFRRLLSVCVLFLGITAAFAWMAPNTQGTSMSWAKDKQGKPKKALAWNRGDTINIFIEADPDTSPPDRAALLREGMLRWKAEMAARGITINVTVGDPPNPEPSGTVRCTFEPASSSKLHGNDGRGGCKSNPNQNALVSGTVYIRDTIPDSTTQDRDYIRNLGQHEITHVLGLADDSNGEVTNHTQYDDRPNAFNKTDSLEIGQLYPLTGDDTPKGEGNTNSSVDPDQYDWDFTYTGPPDGHVALITLDVNPELIVDAIPPPGWIVLNPADPMHTSRDYPFYVDYLECGEPGQAPWDENYTAPLAFRPLVAADALSPANPVVHISLMTHNAVRDSISAWAGGTVQTVAGPVSPADIPTLNEWGLLLSMVLLSGTGILILRRRSRCRQSNC